MIDFSSLFPTLEQAKDAASIISPISTALVSTWITPKLVELKNRRPSLDEEKLSEIFNEYIKVAIARHYYLNTLVYPNSKIPVEDLYVPLTLETVNPRRASFNSKSSKVVASAHRAKINNFPKSLFQKYGKIMVKDVAGMGKSTMLKFLFVKCAESNYGIPIFIHLRQMRSDHNVIDAIVDEINVGGDVISREVLSRLVLEGNFVFFLDGYDEITLEHKEKVTRELQGFIEKGYKNQFILSSRADSALASFQGFQLFTIKPLENEEAYEIIKKYDKYMISDESVGELLIENLSSDSMENVKEFLSNPLLVSLLYKSFSFKPLIPLRLEAFYRQVYDALFEDHDLSKPGRFVREKNSKLDSDDFHRCLRVLAFYTMKIGKLEYTKDELLGFVKQAKQRLSDLEFADAAFLKDLYTTVPLFTCEGDFYRWSHKSIQEYFSAEFICRDSQGRQGDILRSICGSVNIIHFVNVIRMCKSIDEKTFRKTVFRDFLGEFVGVSDALCESSKLDGEEMRKRAALLFLGDVAIVPGYAYDIVKVGEGNLQENLSDFMADCDEDGRVDCSKVIDVSLYAVSSDGGNRKLMCAFRNKWSVMYKMMPVEKISKFDVSGGRNANKVMSEFLSIYEDDEKWHFFNVSGIAESHSLVRMKIENYVLEHVSNEGIFLDVEKCRRLIKTIDAEIERDEKEDYLFDNF